MANKDMEVIGEEVTMVTEEVIEGVVECDLEWVEVLRAMDQEDHGWVSDDTHIKQK